MAKGEVFTDLDVRRVTISAVVTRADGTTEDLGVVADSGDLHEKTSITEKEV